MDLSGYAVPTCEGEARGTDLAQRDRPAHQFQYIRQASRLGSRAQKAFLQQEGTKLELGP